MDTSWRIELFGGLRAHQGDRVITRFQTQKTGALLSYLAFYRHRSHPRDALIEILWPECDRDAGRNRLRVALTSLRHQFEPPGVPPGAVILANRATVQLSPATCLTDVAAFEAALERTPQAGGAEWQERLPEAVALYRGELLPGYVEEWVLPERERLAEAYLQALSELILLREEAGDLAGALQWARRAVSADPLREEGHRELIRLLAATGKREAALRHYRELERLLAAHLAAVPDAESCSLIALLRRQSPLAEHPAKLGRGVCHPSDGPRRELPSSTVTFLLTEIQGASVLRKRAGASFPAVLEQYQELLRPLFRGHGGHEIQVAGGLLQVAFGRASDALAAAVAGQRALAEGPTGAPPGAWHLALGKAGPSPPSAKCQAPSTPSEASMVRMVLHTGELEPGNDPNAALALQTAARLLGAAHGGQILLSEGTAALLRPDLEPGLRLLDLGRYELRPSAPPERLFQVQDAALPPCEFPPPNALSVPVGNLPFSFTRFFGREEEIRRLRELLLGPTTRLVTLTGPGGSGKTRLALEVARKLAPQFHGAVWFVPLGELTDPHLIAEKARDALHVPRSPHLEPFEQLVRALDDQRALLLLDNFEHLIPNGVSLVRALCERVPGLTCLVTSRQRLDLTGEREFRVLPLPIPNAAVPTDAANALLALSQCESVQLFVDRAQAVRPDFQVTPANAAALATLCDRLEGIPLALELAAARAGVLTPAQMLVHLEHRFDFLVSRQRDTASRHRTLRAALDWSYRLLSPELQHFFSQLWVFRGGWSLEATAAVCREPKAVEYLDQLRVCSLVLAEEDGREMRFRLLETLREYACEQLAPEESAAVEQRHAAYYLALAAAAEPHLTRADQIEWLNRLESEHDNLRAALRWSVERGEAELGLRLGAALWRFWKLRGYWGEGRERLAELLALADASTRTAAWARVLNGAGALAFDQGDYEAARAFLEESRKICTELGDPSGIAEVLNILGQVARDQGEHKSARLFHEESLAICRALGDKWGIAHSLTNLGHVIANQGDYQTPLVFLEESLAIHRELGDKWGIAETLCALGQQAREQGDYGAARAFQAESLAIHRELGDKLGIASSLQELAVLAYYLRDDEAARALCEESLVILRKLGARLSIAYSLYILAKVASRRGEYETAQALHQESLTIRRDVGEKRGIAWSLTNLGMVSYHQAQYDSAYSLLEESLDLWQELGIQVGIAECLNGLAWLASVRGQPERAARLLGATARMHETIGPGPSPLERGEGERHLAAVRATMGEEAFEAAWAAGQALTLEQALAEARGSAEEPGME